MMERRIIVGEKSWIVWCNNNSHEKECVSHSWLGYRSRRSKSHSIMSSGHHPLKDTNLNAKETCIHDYSLQWLHYVMTTTIESKNESRDEMNETADINQRSLFWRRWRWCVIVVLVYASEVTQDHLLCSSSSCMCSVISLLVFVVEVQVSVKVGVWRSLDLTWLDVSDETWDASQVGSCWCRSLSKLGMNEILLSSQILSVPDFCILFWWILDLFQEERLLVMVVLQGEDLCISTGETLTA